MFSEMPAPSIIYSRRLALYSVLVISLGVSFALVGKQIFFANWSLIDNWDYFNWLGPKLHLPISEVWSTLLTKTEVGTGGRFRPTYYFFMILETSLWGPNVHLWYLARTVEFGLFIASVWWVLSRFVGLPLGGALTVPFLGLSCWPDTWARLGPSEIYGTISIAVILFGACGLFGRSGTTVRTLGAMSITGGTILLLGAKETFLPIAGLSIALLLLAAFRGLVHRAIALFLLFAIVAFGVMMLVAVLKIIVAAGADTNGQSILLPLLPQVVRDSLFRALALWMPLYLIAIGGSRAVVLWRGQDLREWKYATLAAVALFAFLVAMFVSQSVAYRSVAPLGTRYDFPKVLFTPVNVGVLACYLGYVLRTYVSDRSLRWLALATALIVVPGFYRTQFPSLKQAVDHNIRVTSSFFSALQSIVSAGKAAPDAPIILEAHGPLSWAYEPAFSLLAYLHAYGAPNPVSVRVRSKVEDRLGELVIAMQEGSRGFVPLSESLKRADGACISVGINGDPAPECRGFQVRTE